MSNIIRVEKNNNYVVMNRTALNDERLSWKAKGIIAYMLSMPDDWVFYVEELVTHSTDGERAFRAGFKELQEAGYVVRKPIREGQRIKSWETIVYEVPQDNSLLCGSVHVENEDVQNLHVQNEDVQSVHVQNSGLLSTDINQVLNKPNTDTNQVLTNQHTDLPLDTDFAEVLSIYEQNFGLVSGGFDQEDLGDMVDNYKKDLIIEAIKEARSNQNVKKPLRLISKILKNWAAENIHTAIDLQNYLQQKEREQHGQNNRRSTSRTKKQTKYPGLANYNSQMR